MMRRWRRLGLPATLGLLWLACLNASCAGPLQVEPLQICPTPVMTDGRLALARAYAPFVYHAVHPRKGRQDIPTRVDFDGDLQGNNNWENFPRYRLPPTLYYAVLETETHYFLAYHLFHPRDWCILRVGLNETHENDGENLQVVVEKVSGQVVLLFTQAHYRGRAYAAKNSGFASGRKRLREDLLLLDDAGRPDSEGRHAAVFVQAFGHGIYGALDGESQAAIAPDGNVSFKQSGLVFRPAVEGEPVAEPSLDRRIPIPYQLESLTAKLWPGVRDGSLLGDGKLLDGTVPYKGKPVPRYYDGNRFSGPLGPDRGISPFALDFGFSPGTVGALFFDPARRYAECLGVPSSWSMAYVAYPFSPAP